MKSTKFIVVPLLSILAVLCFQSEAFGKKPSDNSQFSLVPTEVEEFYRFENMRVSKKTGAPVALYNVNYAVTPSTPLNMASQYLEENASLLRMKSGLDDLEHTVTRETPGGYHVRFFQQIDGYPVYGTDIVVNLNRQNEVTFVMNNYKPQLELSVTTPVISQAMAEKIADDYLNVQGSIRHRDRTTVVYVSDSKARLVHDITIVPAEDKFGDWEILVDAVTGEVLRAEDKSHYEAHATGSCQVFDPDPLTHAQAVYGGPFGDNNDADSDSLTAHIVQRNLVDVAFDGMYHLRGTYAEIVDSESPFFGLFSQATNTWHFTRNPSGFEAATVYYHIDASMRYINETLGFSLMPYQYSGGVRCDPHGLGGADNSHYIPSLGELAWGEGGVDDSEDTDVILHELGHGLHDWLTNGGLSQVNGLSEGSGDYWANSYNRSTGYWTPSDPQFHWVYQWDGHNEFWGGRVTNYPNLYPGGLVGQIHTDGQIWSSTLMQIWGDIGRTATDSNFLEALAMTNSSTNQQDAAQAFIQADVNLHGGANLGPIEYWFTQRGYIVTVPVPVITHTPLSDSEDVLGPYPVSADVVGSFPLDEVQLIYGTGGAFTDTLSMVLQSGDTYTSAIPGTGSPADYNYYIFAADTTGLARTSPDGAPGNFHSFETGPDVTPPAIAHTPLGNQAYLFWPADVEATITDNIGISSAWVEYSVNNGALSGSFPLTNTSGDEYSGTFPIDTTMVAVGDTVEYRIVAEDVSLAANQALDPSSGDHLFEIIDVLGVILIIDDDPVSLSATHKSEKGESVRDLFAMPYGKSATDMETYLLDAGYTVVVETPAATNPATWGSYDLLISASGINESSLSSATYRNALIAHAQAGEKFLVEGGEVGWTWRNDATMMSDVLHSSSWEGDDVGTLNLIGSQAAHPMVTTPNALPSSIPITYTAYGSEDAMTATDSYVIYDTTTDPGDAGVAVYDQDVDLTTAQSVYYAFNFGQVTNTTVARELLENTVHYLLQPEPDTVAPVVTVVSPNGGETWYAGDSEDITWTASDANGVSSISLYYSIDGGTTFPFTIATGEANDSVYSWTVPATVTDSAVVRVVAYDPSLNTGEDVSDAVFAIANEITPPAVAVTSPNGGESWFANDSHAITWTATDSSGVDSLSLYYSVDGGQNFIEIASGEPNDSSYDWTVPDTPTDSAMVMIIAYDAHMNAAADTSDSLFTIGSQLGIPGDPTLGNRVLLSQSVPNPFRASTEISFYLPEAEVASLEVFDLSGRRVAVLVDQQLLGADQHRVVWNGYSDNGVRVGAGVYFYRLRAGDIHISRKLLVMR